MKSLLLLAALVSLVDSPAEQKIVSARRWIEKDSGSYAARNALALALARRARETADPSYYNQAEEALEASFRLSPDNFEAARMRVWLLLGKHEFARALEEAKALKARMPDDLLTYAFLADAHVELGNYAEAEEAAQWLLDLRPGNVAGLTRGAYLRELFGDIEGALEWMLMAHDQTHFNENEDRAWILTHMGHLEWSRGRLEAADEHLTQALELFPDYHYALGELSKVRLAQKRFGEAVSLLRLRYEKAPHPENLYELAEALAAAGETEKAFELFTTFERQAKAESEGLDNANRELLFFYADRASKPESAFAIGEREIGRRRDVFTRDAYAWALHRIGKSSAARVEIEGALEVGIRDARMLYHAGAICAGSGDQEAAARYFRESLALNPHSPVAEKARESLARLNRTGGVEVFHAARFSDTSPRPGPPGFSVTALEALGARTASAAVLSGRELHDDVGDVGPLAHEEPVGRPGRNVDQVACLERMTFSTLDPRSDVFTGAVSRLSVDHLPAHHQGAFTRPHDHHVHLVVVLLGVTVPVPIEHSEPVVLVRRQGLARGVILAHLPGEGRLPLDQLAGSPQREPLRTGGERQSSGYGKNHGHHWKAPLPDWGDILLLPEVPVARARMVPAMLHAVDRVAASSSG